MLLNNFNKNFKEAKFFITIIEFIIAKRMLISDKKIIKFNLLARFKALLWQI